MVYGNMLALPLSGQIQQTISWFNGTAGFEVSCKLSTFEIWCQ